MKCGRFRALTLRPTNGLTLIESFDTKFLFVKILEIVALSVHKGSQLRLSSKAKKTNKQTLTVKSIGNGAGKPKEDPGAPDIRHLLRIPISHSHNKYLS